MITVTPPPCINFQNQLHHVHDWHALKKKNTTNWFVRHCIIAVLINNNTSFHWKKIIYTWVWLKERKLQSHGHLNWYTFNLRPHVEFSGSCLTLKDLSHTHTKVYLHHYKATVCESSQRTLQQSANSPAVTTVGREIWKLKGSADKMDIKNTQESASCILTEPRLNASQKAQRVKRGINC